MLLLPFMLISSLLAFSDGILQIYIDGNSIHVTTADREKVKDELTRLIEGIQPRYVYNAGCSFASTITFSDEDKKNIQLSLFFYTPDVCGSQFKSSVSYATGQDLQNRFKPLVDEVLKLLDNQYEVGYVVSGQFQVGYSFNDAKTDCNTPKKNFTVASEAHDHCYGFDSILMSQSAFNSLYASCQLESSNKKYALKMTLGCKLLLVEAATNVTVWSAPYNEAGHSGCFLIAQNDWNLVVYNGSHSPLWVSSSGYFTPQGRITPGNVWLGVGSNRDLTLYLTVSGVQSVWSSNTAVDDRENVTDANDNGITVFPVSPANATDDVTVVRKNKTLVLVLLTVLSFSIILLCLLFTLLWRLRRKQVEAKISKSMTPSQLINYSFKTLELATQGFHSSNKLGQGGYGVVYKGIIPTVGGVAIKQLQFVDEERVDFVNEVLIISSLQHKHLIKLIGFCYEGNHRLLVYEYLEHNSLRQALHGSRLYLPWNARYHICVGVAKGLAYLHEESRMRIVHRDIKASNILLDKDLNAKIADFGLARFMRDLSALEWQEHLDTLLQSMPCMDKQPKRWTCIHSVSLGWRL